MKKLIRLGNVALETRSLFQRCKGSVAQDTKTQTGVDTTCASYGQNSICLWSNSSAGRTCTI